MTTDSNFQFIREKIYTLRSAIMYSMSTELVKLPDNVVTAIRVDEDGQLWFLSKRPLQLVSECAQSFPARLKFYRKGVEFYMEVSGHAMIMNADALPDWVFTSGENIFDRRINPVLVKMSMQQVEYFEPTYRNKFRIDQVLRNAYKWLVRTTTLQRHEKAVFGNLRQSHH